MRLSLLTLLASLLVSLLTWPPLRAQSRAELEELRRKNLQEIEYVDNLLKSTAAQKSENLNELRVIGNKLSLREKLINEYGQEVNLLEYRITLNTLAITMLEEDLSTLKGEYEKSIVSAFKATKGTPALAYILSSTDFNQGYKRLKYIQQIARYRRNESQTIESLYKVLNRTREGLVNDRINVASLKGKEERQKALLGQERAKRQTLINNLGKKEKQLKQELDDKRRIARQIEKEIEKLIEAERRKSDTAPLSREMMLIGDSFEENRGRLPWPVNNGIVTSRFGKQPHPVLKNVIEDNLGIEITSSGAVTARAVFKGEVVTVFAISGANMAVIVRHGKYLTVYQNLVNVLVKVGDAVLTGQELGSVYLNQGEGGKALLTFMVYDERKKLDPELWLVKK